MLRVNCRRVTMLVLYHLLLCLCSGQCLRITLLGMGRLNFKGQASPSHFPDRLAKKPNHVSSRLASKRRSHTQSWQLPLFALALSIVVWSRGGGFRPGCDSHAQGGKALNYKPFQCLFLRKCTDQPFLGVNAQSYHDVMAALLGEMIHYLSSM